MITKQLMERLFPTKNLDPRRFNLVRERDRLIAALNIFLPKYGINTHRRICAFLGNCGIETDYFRTTIEYASGEDYEGRKNLGNTERGDGRRFKGRGLTQTTGRANYEAVQKAIGQALGINVIKNPELLAQIEIAVESACIFWRDNNLNAYADRGEFRQLSGIVNRGDKNKTPLHWAKRNELYSKCIRYVPKDFTFAELPTEQNYDNPARIPHPAEVLPLVVAANNNPVALTPTGTIDSPSEGELANDETSFLASALDKNVSPDEIKTAARTAAPRILVRFARPFAILYAMLEAGNIYAWLGIAVGVIGLGVLIYLHRDDLKKVWETVKNKFLQ
ncbi:MAG: hypothetical protein H0U50_06100 [Pyrinomonadaceae bacterium]|nr:hypothetical protein [Pyrinomonadaceae bacterium]